jgi:thiamine monophosphate synthase
MAAGEGADYVVFGTVFPSGSKPRGHRTAGLDALAAVVAAVHVPVLAIGGISLNTVAAAAEAGASGVAAIGLFFDAAGPIEDLRGRLIQTVAGLRRAFDRQSGPS